MASQNPIVSFDGIGYEITLFRPGKENKYLFGQHNLTVHCTSEDTLTSWQRSQVKGPVAEDGQLYYLSARSDDISLVSFIWLKDKEESLALRKAIQDAEYLYSQEDSKCTFCGYMVSECGEDHGDEMRQIQREALERD